MSRPQIPSPAAPVLKALALTVMVLLAAACARLSPPVEDTPARVLWQSFQDARRHAADAGPALSARASLQYNGPKRKSRVLLKLWGDLGYPLRLDMEAGIGASIAFLREDDAGWIAYFPRSGEAVVSPDPRRGLWSLGVDAPLSLADLAGLVAGTYQGLAPDRYDSAEPTGDGGWTYAFQESGPVSRMTLDALARPVSMAGRWADGPWEMTLTAYDDGDTPGRMARKMTLERPPDTRVIIRIKEHEQRLASWPPEAMTLELPSGTRIIPPVATPPGSLP